MDVDYFETHIWPHMFYIQSKNIWLWKMNAARAIGNTLDPKYVPHLIRAFGENDDERTKGMMVWSLGRIGGADAQEALNRFLPEASGLVKEEIERAISMVAN